jgi:hypothetical protein
VVRQIGVLTKEVFEMTWKVYVSVVGENCDAHGWHTNALTFPTREEAEIYGRDLYARWTAVTDWEAREVATEGGEAS